MDETSSLVFRSNVYVVNPDCDIAEDRDFTSSITDPFALVRMRAYDETNRRGRRKKSEILSPLQEMQVKKAQPCMLADEGYHPWGTKVIHGKKELVCLCEKRSCVLYGQCMESHPSVFERATPHTRTAAAAAAHVNGDPTEGASMRRKRLGVERRDPLKMRGYAEGAPAWTAEEDELLRKMFVRYPREILYCYFPDREVDDIESRILKVCF